MSIQAMSWVIDHSKQTGQGFVTLLMIANHANAEGRQSYPSMKTLAKECRSSVRSIQRTILKIEQSGELIVHRSGGRICHSYSLPLMFNVDTESTLPTPQRRQGGHVKQSQPGQRVATLQPGHCGHVESQRGQMEPSNVDTGGLNVDIAVSTKPLEPSLEPKEPSAHAQLMEFLRQRNGPIPNPGKDGKAAKWILEHGYTFEQAKACFDSLASEEWRTVAVTWSTVQSQIGPWLKRQANGHPGLDPAGNKILTDSGDSYTVMGDDGTPSKRWRNSEAFARDTGRDAEEVKAKWN